MAVPTRRTSKAQATRQRMLDAARRLFIRQGYPGTRIEDIAREAGVAVQTVYFTFGNKRTVLKELVDCPVAGDPEPASTLLQGWASRALVEPEPARQLRLQVQVARKVYESIGPLLEVVRSAAAVDPEVAGLWVANKRQRLDVQVRFAESLAAKGGLQEGLTAAAAADVAYALLSPELLEVFLDRGWSLKRWERWALEALSGQLLAPPARADRQAPTQPSPARGEGRGVAREGAEGVPGARSA
jgi:AcrR family transcriptional regulator